MIKQFYMLVVQKFCYNVILSTCGSDEWLWCQKQVAAGNLNVPVGLQAVLFRTESQQVLRSTERERHSWSVSKYPTGTFRFPAATRF